MRRCIICFLCLSFGIWNGNEITWNCHLLTQQGDIVMWAVTDPGGGCRGWQTLPNGDWRPCTFATGAPLAQDDEKLWQERKICTPAEGTGASVFVCICWVSQSFSNFYTKGIIWVPSHQQRRPPDMKWRPFHPPWHPSKEISAPPSSPAETPFCHKKCFLAYSDALLVEMAPLLPTKVSFWHKMVSFLLMTAYF